MILLLSGKRGVGKDYIADYLVSKYNFSKMSLAEQVKIEYCKLNGVDYSEMLDRNKKEKHRKKIIELAEGKKKEDLHYWCKILQTVITGNVDKHFVICDIRYQEELEYFTENNLNIYFIRINCSEEERKTRGIIINNIDKDKSETYFDNYDFEYIFESNNEILINISNFININI